MRGGARGYGGVWAQLFARSNSSDSLVYPRAALRARPLRTRQAQAGKFILGRNRLATDRQGRERDRHVGCVGESKRQDGGDRGCGAMAMATRRTLYPPTHSTPRRTMTARPSLHGPIHPHLPSLPLLPLLPCAPRYRARSAAAARIVITQGPCHDLVHHALMGTL